MDDTVIEYGIEAVKLASGNVWWRGVRFFVDGIEYQAPEGEDEQRARDWFQLIDQHDCATHGARWPGDCGWAALAGHDSYRWMPGDPIYTGGAS